MQTKLVNRDRLPWGIFLLLSTIFWFASRADIFYTVKDPPMASALADGRADDPIKAAALLALIAWSGYTLWRGRRFSSQVNILQVGLLLMYSVWSTMSVLWTDDTKLTLSKVAILLVTCLASGAMAYRFSFRELAVLVFLGSFASNAIGFVAEVALGTFRPLDGLYRFSGLWHPNAHGVSLSVLVLAGLALLRSERKYRIPIALMTAFGFVLLLLSRSRTSFGSTLIAAACTWLLTLAPARRWTFLWVGSAAACLVSFVSVNDLGKLPVDMVLLGRQDGEASTLTNRIPLWKACLPYIEQRPLLGFGYGGFWTPVRILTLTAPEETAWNNAYEKYVAENSYLPDAHNLYIETVLGTGIIGAIFLIGDLFLAIGSFGVKLSRTGAPAYSFAFSILLWMSLESMLEAISPQPFFPLLICPVLLMKIAWVSEEPMSARQSLLTPGETEFLPVPEIQHA